MNKKQKGAQAEEAYQKQQRQIRYGIMKDRYPNVKSIKFEFDYTDADNLAQPHSMQYVRSPEHSALFEFKCPNHECIDGGHNLTDIVKRIIETRQLECAGKINCQGWSDRERQGKYRCLYELSYKFIVCYEGEKLDI